jgi:hypothetical protein
MISQSLIIEFQQALKEDYGKDVTLEEAFLMLSDLTGYFDVLSKVYHKMQSTTGNGTIVKPD